MTITGATYTRGSAAEELVGALLLWKEWVLRVAYTHKVVRLRRHVRIGGTRAVYMGGAGPARQTPKYLSRGPDAAGVPCI